MTIVNGEVLVEKDKHTGALPGAVLGCGNALLHRRSGGGPARGDHALPLTDDELLSKYRDCARCSFVHRSILRSANLDGVKGFAFAPNRRTGSSRPAHWSVQRSPKNDESYSDTNSSAAASSQSHPFPLSHSNPSHTMTAVFRNEDLARK